MKVVCSDPFSLKQHFIKRLVNRSIPFLKRRFSFPDNVLIYTTDLPNRDNTYTLGAVTPASRSVNSMFDGQILCFLNNTLLDINDGIVNTLSHEFTHIEQLHEGRLVPYTSSMSVWLNKTTGTVSFYELNNNDFRKYLTLPWEIEANERADEFTSEFAWPIVGKSSLFYAILREIGNLLYFLWQIACVGLAASLFISLILQCY